MGGSALPGDVLSIWLSAYKIGLPLYIHRNYGLPYQADERHLIICISYSGDTEETLTAFEEARSKGFKIAVITSGGKLARLCKKYKIPMAVIPRGYQPRMALGFQFAALIKILVNCGIIRNNLENIANLEKQLLPKTLEAEGKKLSKKLRGKIPIIYSSERLKGLARIWKIKFNENAKIPAFYNYFPELNHNEMTGFSDRGPNSMRDQNSIIILRDPTDHPRIQKRMKLLSQILKPKKIPINFIDIQGRDVLYKTFSTILLGDWVSYYLALEYKIDPTPVKLVKEFKKKL
jgi:glucose/mannose-6-phosphate isomerase